MSGDGVDRVPRISLTSVVGSDEPQTAQAAADLWFLTVLGEQARLALSHLLRVWQWEGEPPDPAVWYRKDVESEVVWGDLQGALFAGIVIDRVLRAPKPKKNPTSAEVQKRTRAERLRALLEVPENSPLLKIADVRNSMEHLDERMDSIIADPDIASVTDAAISRGGLWFRSVEAEDVAEDENSSRHVAMRIFSPEMGLLIYDNDLIDLWAWEAALHGLLVQIRGAQDGAAKRLRGRARYGTSKPERWDVAQLGAERRVRIEEIRAGLRASGEFLLRPSSRPGTIDFVLQPGGGFGPVAQS